MRILIIHTTYKIRGGEDSVVYNEAELLRSAGHEVELLLFSNSGSTGRKLIQLPFNASSYFTTLKTINVFNPDVIHIHNLHFAGSPAVLYAAKKMRVPIVMTLHNYRLLCPSGTLFFKGKIFTESVNKIFPIQTIFKGVYQNSKLITFWVALSAAIHQLAGTWNIPKYYIVLGANSKRLFEGSKMRAIANRMLVKPNFCYPGEPGVNSKDYYLYIGRLSAEKGIAMLLNTFTKINTVIKIAGSGPMESEIIASATLHPNIEFLGSKDKDEVRTLIAGAKAVIFPSVWFETFGMVVIEAFACGVPVIAAEIGEAPHIITDKINGLLFEPGNETDLFKKIKYFEDLSSDRYMIFCKNALKTYSDNFTPAKNLNRLNQIYELACARN